MIIKTALGVFLGIALFAIVLQCIMKGPEWVRDWKENSARSSFYALTPDLAKSRCGAARDWTDELTGWRFVQFYRKSDRITLHFMKGDDGSWFFSGFVSDPSADGRFERVSAQGKLEMLPCLVETSRAGS